MRTILFILTTNLIIVHVVRAVFFFFPDRGCNWDGTPHMTSHLRGERDRVDFFLDDSTKSCTFAAIFGVGRPQGEPDDGNPREKPELFLQL